MPDNYLGPDRRREEEIRAFAKLEAKVETLEKTCGELKDSVELLTSMLNQTKGGWFVISTVGAAAMSVGALIATFFNK